MPEGGVALVVLIALALFVYFLLFTGKANARREEEAPPSPEEQARRDTAIEQLEKHAESVRRKMQETSADLDEDPAAAARTLRRIMKKR